MFIHRYDRSAGTDSQMGKPKGDFGDLLYPLQLLPGSEFNPLHSGNGEWHHPRLDAAGIARGVSVY
jgi:hypothetical protein